MSLSNTATPRYYGEFREQVLRGEIPVNREISMEMNRIDDLIRDPRYYYDDEAVEGFIDFCESELTLTDGGDMVMLPSFKIWAEQLLSWYEFVDRSIWEAYPDGHGGRFVNKRVPQRLTKIQYIVLGRGGAKTMYASDVQSYFLTVDTSTTQQVTTAPTMKQAEEVLFPIRTAIVRSKGPWFQFLTEGSLNNTTGSKAFRQKLASTKKGIENFLTGSFLEIKPLSIDKLQGLRCKVVTLDEWLSGTIRENPITALEQGAAKGGIDDYVIIATSSEGTVRNGVGDSIKMELMEILKGEYYAPHVSIWYYKLDDISEVADPNMWIKANPNLGITVTYEAYRRDVEKAEHNPSQRNEILAKRFGIPMEGYTYFFTYEETLPFRKQRFNGMPCAMGTDLSMGDDFCSFTFLFPLRDRSFGIKSRSYITERTLINLPLAMRQEYQRFINEGSLVIMEGSVLDMTEVYDDLDQFILDTGYDVRCFGYDPYNAKDFVERWQLENGPYGIVKVIQGSKTESVPLGELKILAEDRQLRFDQLLMQFCMGNCIVLVDTNGNRKLYKQRREQKIDAVAAMMDAYIAYKLNKEAFD